MKAENKKIIYDILTDKNLSIDEKFFKIIKIFPNYLSKIEERKSIYEKIEWIFHDGLWTYFELLIIKNISEFYNILQDVILTESLEKMNLATDLYKKFFENNEYNIDFDWEKKNIENWANNSLKIIQDIVWERKIIKVLHSAWDFRVWNARDIILILETNEEINLSLKTDKSWRMAISEWQTPKIFEKVYNRYFNLTFKDYILLKNELFWTDDEESIFQDFQNIALLTQKVIIKQFSLINVEINNFKNAKITNLENFKFFLLQLKKFKNGKDNAFVLLVNRTTGNVGFESILDSLDLNNISLEDFSFTPCIPRWYKYATEPGIKYKWKTFISFQIKHKRGKWVSDKFWDITIRLRSK